MRHDPDTLGNTLTEVRVRQFEQEPGAPTAVVVLEDLDARRSMSISLPASHAAPLRRALSLADPGCSPACEVALAPVRRLEAAVVRVVIGRGSDGVGAELTVSHSGSTLAIACSVGDALTLAIRGRAPIYATLQALGGDGPNGFGKAQGGVKASTLRDEERGLTWRGHR